MSSSQAYSVEDWLVHTDFGVGQIKGIETKNISGANVQYYRIQTNASTFWIPIDRINGKEMRPLSTTVVIQMAAAILRRPPKTMTSDPRMRKSAIQQVQSENILEDIARLVRDLRARHRERGELSLDERTAMRALKHRLVEEWSIVMGEDTEHVESRLDELLNYQQAQKISS